MKYRLVETLQCPSHPETVLRVVGTRVSEVFPFSGDVESPFCNSACGLLGNWLKDIPFELSSVARLNCRRCLGTEIEKASLVCPDCGWTLGIESGVLKGSSANKTNDTAEEILPLRVGQTAGRLLDPRAFDRVLVLAPVPEAVVEKWGAAGAERFQIELQSELLVCRRARSCANGHGITHYIEGPLPPEVLRSRQFDMIISSVPPARIAEPAENLEHLLRIIKRSGRILLVLSRGRKANSARGRLTEHLGRLPESFRTLVPRLVSCGEHDLLLLTPEPVEVHIRFPRQQGRKTNAKPEKPAEKEVRY